MSRNKARQWEVEAEDGYDRFLTDICTDWRSGDNRREGSRLNKVIIGDWLKIERIKGKRANSKEVYLVKFGDIEYIVRLTDKDEYMVRLAWADSFVNAKPENIGQLNNTTPAARKKNKG